MPASASAAANASELYWGLRRERGRARTSANSSTPFARSSATVSSWGRIEWPRVRITSGDEQAQQVYAHREPGGPGQDRDEPRGPTVHQGHVPRIVARELAAGVAPEHEAQGRHGAEHEGHHR